MIRDAGGGGVRSVRCAKRVVDINLSQGSELFRKGRIVFLFLFMVTDVLKQHDIAGLQSGSLGFRIFTDYVLSHDNLFAEKFREPFGDWSE